MNRMDRQRRLERCTLMCLLLLAFLPRALYPVSRPLQWYFRSSEFIKAVANGNWQGTLFSPHPGVTVMWLSGGALWGWYRIQSLLGLNPPTPLEIEGYAFAGRVNVGVLPLALITALGIIWAWHLLRRLFGKRVAWVSALLWTLDPFHLTNSKVLHLDATLSTLMMLSALLMLVHLKHRKQGALIWSAILGGLAILTKVTAVFLFPFLGLCLLTDWLSSIAGSHADRQQGMLTIRSFLIWLVVASSVCLTLWPSLWVQPAATFDMVVNQGILDKVTGAHGLPRFHRGTLAVGDPGMAFYIDTLLFRTTFLTLPFSLVGLVAVLSQRKKEMYLLASFAVFYVVQMMLGSRKESRYLLPALVALDVISAWGIVAWSNRLSKVPGVRLALTVSLLATQAAIVLSKHPYYGIQYNTLLGGARAARRVLPPGEFGEGLDLAGQYVERQAGAGETVVGTQFLANEMVAQHVRAPVVDVNEAGDDTDYLVFGVQYNVRGQDFARWGALWERIYRFRDPLYVAEFGDLPYAWVHEPSAKPSIRNKTHYRLGSSIHLDGFRLDSYAVSPRDTLLVTLHWHANDQIEHDYTVFTHVQNEEGALIAQMDGVPANAERPTTTWEQGDLIEDHYEISIPSDTPPGRYAVSTGMYEPGSLSRLTAFDAEGEKLAGGRIPLATVRVQPPVPQWRQLLSGLWLLIILAGYLRPGPSPAPSNW